LFEVVVVNNNESRNARAKLKIRGYPNKDDTTVWQVLCLFLACSRKMVAKALDFAKKKEMKRYSELLRFARNDRKYMITS
jgi:hypothetical protein